MSKEKMGQQHLNTMLIDGKSVKSIKDGKHTVRPKKDITVIGKPQAIIADLKAAFPKSEFTWEEDQPVAK